MSTWVVNASAPFGCEGGVPVLASNLTQPDCRVHNMGCDYTKWCCEDGDASCDPGACVDDFAPGAPCESSGQCSTGVCGVPQAGGAKVCLVLGGDECTTSNCEHCVLHGSSYLCDRPCDSNNQCPGGQLCSAADYLCAPTCNNGTTCTAHFYCPVPGSDLTWVCIRTGS